MTSQSDRDTPSLADRLFTADRLFAYPLIFIAVYVIASAIWIGISTDMLDPKGKPLGYDFITFWAASWLTLQGDAAGAFDPAKIFAAEQIAVPASDKIFLWHYPPTFLMVVTPFALVPYIVAYLLWGTATFALYAWVIRKLAPQPQTLLLLLAFPGVFLNFFHGQNAFLSAALLGGAILTLERRPIVAGILIGLMSYKPHFGVLIPLALICGRHWQAFGAAAVTTILFAAASVLALGIEPWIAFWNNIPLAREVFEDGLIRWGKLPTLYASLRLAGAGVEIAYALHVALGVGVRRDRRLDLVAQAAAAAAGRGSGGRIAARHALHVRLRLRDPRHSGRDRRAGRLYARLVALRTRHPRLDLVDAADRGRTGGLDRGSDRSGLHLHAVPRDRAPRPSA